jgi:hypothetical protein
MEIRRVLSDEKVSVGAAQGATNTNAQLLATLHILKVCEQAWRVYLKLQTVGSSSNLPLQNEALQIL